MVGVQNHEEIRFSNLKIAFNACELLGASGLPDTADSACHDTPNNVHLLQQKPVLLLLLVHLRHTST